MPAAGLGHLSLQLLDLGPILGQAALEHLDVVGAGVGVRGRLGRGLGLGTLEVALGRRETVLGIAQVVRERLRPHVGKLLAGRLERGLGLLNADRQPVHLLLGRAGPEREVARLGLSDGEAGRLDAGLRLL